MINNVQLLLRKKIVLKDRLIISENYFQDGDFGDFENNILGITSSTSIVMSNEIAFIGNNSLRVLMDPFQGNIILQGTSNIVLSPNSEYFITAQVYQSWQPPVNDRDLFIGFSKSGWSDGILTMVQDYQWTTDNEGNWENIVYKLTTGNSVAGQISIIISGIDRFNNSVVGEYLYIDTVKISNFIPYVGDIIQYGEEHCLPVAQNLNTSLQFKIRELNKINLLLQRSKSTQLTINATHEVEQFFGYSHLPNSVRGNSSWEQEFLATLEISGYPILKGIFSLDELRKENCDYNKYIGKIISDSKIWVSLLEGKCLSDLEWSEYNHIANFENYEFAISGDGSNRLWTYGIFETESVPDIIGNNYRVNLTLIPVQLFIVPMIEKIYRSIGYTIKFEGAILNSPDFYNLLVTPVNCPRFINRFISRNSTIIGYYDGTETLDDSSGNQFPDFESIEDDAFNWINGHCLNKEQDYVLTAQIQVVELSGLDAPSGQVSFNLPAISTYDGQVICFRLEYEVDFSLNSFQNNTHWVKIEMYTGTTVIQTQYLFNNNEPQWSNNSHTINNVTSIAGGYEISYIDGQTGQGGQTYTFGFSQLFGNGTNNNTYASLIRPAINDEKGHIRDVNKGMCCINIIEFLKSIILLRNIVVLTDEDKKQITWIARNDFYREDRVFTIDNNKITGEEIQKRLSKKSSKQLSFKYTHDDEDEWLKERVSDSFGNATISNDNGNSGLENSTENTSIFSPTASYEPLVGLWVQRSLGYSTIRVFMWEGVQQINTGSITLKHFLASPTKSYTEYPRISFASEQSISTNNLSFDEYSGNLGIAESYWRIDLDLIKNARLIKTQLMLSITEVNNLDFRLLWVYKDIICILNQIVDFDPHFPENPAIVELITTNNFYP